MTDRLQVLKYGFTPFFTLLLFCSLALVLSLPFPIRPADAVFGLSPARPSAFFFTYVLMLAIFGITRGTRAASTPRRASAFAWMAAEIGLAQLTLLPLVVFARVLATRQPLILPLAVVYSSCLSFMWGLLAFRLERWARARSVSSFALRYGIFLVATVAPFISVLGTSGVPFVLLLSPIGAMTALLNAPHSTLLVLVFALPIAFSALTLAVPHQRSVMPTP